MDAKTGRKLTLEEPLTTINFPLFSAVHRLSRFPDFNITIGPITIGKKWGCDRVKEVAGFESLGKNGIFVRRSVQELLFGYRDDLWVMLHNTFGIIGYRSPTTFRLTFNHSVPMPEYYTGQTGQVCPLADDEGSCNNSGTQVTYEYTGTNWKLSSPDDGQETQYGSLRQQGEYRTFAGNDVLWWWGKDGDCQHVGGTNGVVFGAGLTKQSHPAVLVEGFFRKVMLDCEGETSAEGIDVLRFVTSRKEIEIGPDTNARCYQNEYVGVMNLTAPLFAPFYITKPMFRDVDLTQKIIPETLREHPTGREILNITIDGVPIRDINSRVVEFESYFDIFPMTGTTVEAHARCQINTWLRPLSVEDCPDLFPANRGRLPAVIVPVHSLPCRLRRPSHCVIPPHYLDPTR